MMAKSVAKRDRERDVQGRSRRGAVPPVRPPRARVAIHIADDCTLNRGKVLGILEFLRKRPQWDIPLREATPYMSFEDILEWRGDAVIGNFYDHEAVRKLHDLGMIVVNTASGIDESYQIPTVCVDSGKIGEMGAEHLLKRKFRSLAFAGFHCGENTVVHFHQREAAFAQAVIFRGLSYEAFWYHYKNSPRETLMAAPWKTFLQKLKRPVGIFAAADHVAFGILQACRELGIIVPDEVAVLGVDDDQILCQLAVPRMSSIDPRAEVVGYKAAALLQQLLDGQKPQQLREEVPPGEIRQRASTDVIATSNLEVAEAIRFIHAHAGENINVNDVLRVVSISRRSLERHFREVTGSGVYEAIRKAHLELAQKYLLETKQTIDEIARRSGFSNAQRMNEAFVAVLGGTASQYRDRTRA